MTPACTTTTAFMMVVPVTMITDIATLVTMTRASVADGINLK